MHNSLDFKAISQFFRKQAHNLDKIWNQYSNLKAIQICNHLITSDDIYNIWKEVIKEDQILHKIEE
ncbi:10950_t:CDS:1, partial [Cetraspora pellucida]